MVFLSVKLRAMGWIGPKMVETVIYVYMWLISQAIGHVHNDASDYVGLASKGNV